MKSDTEQNAIQLAQELLAKDSGNARALLDILPDQKTATHQNILIGASREIDELRQVLAYLTWRPIAELTPLDGPILIVDDHGSIDIALWRASKGELIKQWRGINAKAVWWMPLPKPPAGTAQPYYTRGLASGAILDPYSPSSFE